MPTIFHDDPRVLRLFKAQDEILERLSPILASRPEIRMAGGTVLGREWLHHRISFDLDFFVPPDFPLKELKPGLAKTGFSTTREFSQEGRYGQLFGEFVVKGQPVEVSFIQDRLHDIFTPVRGRHLDVLLEDASAIFQRKIRIIAGLAGKSRTGRSRARDLFDLCVLSSTVEPIADAAGNMLEDVIAGLANVDPLTVVTDGRLFVHPEWERLSNGELALAGLMRELGMTVENVDDAWERDSDDAGKPG